MSCEESYLAIRRYLTDEREPYAPGTHGNTKRKIRKAAACYVVRNGTLYYQRRQKGLDAFTELEVVLQDGRRKELIDQSHITTIGEHINQHQTWESISQNYWWRGILKQVKDYIKKCSHCQSRQDRGGLTDDPTGPRPVGRPGRRRAAAVRMSDEEDEDDEEDEEGDEDLDAVSSFRYRRARTSNAAKHELVFVDSNGVVKQYLPRHGQTMLDKLNQQRLANQFCDITLLIEGEEHRAHKAVLAACSDYFNELFVEKGAESTHEAVVDLSGFTKASFLPLLDFAYTSNLTFNFCMMAEVATLARHLLMAEVLQICESVHRQVEEQRLMVYQRGDVHTVLSSHPGPPEAFADDSGAYMVTIRPDGQAVVTHAGEAAAREALAGLAHAVETMGAEAGAGRAETPLGGEPGRAETVTLVARGAQAGAGESMTLISRCGEARDEGGTVTVVTHSGQAGASESLAVVSACLAMEQQPQEGEAAMAPGGFLISVDPGEAPPTEAVQVKTGGREEAAPREGASARQAVEPAPQPQMEPAPQPQKRKRGRPAKVKQEAVPEEPAAAVEEVPEPPPPAPPEEGQGENASDDPYKRRLRQRSMGEGGYVRLHMGLENEEPDKKSPTPQRPGTPKVGQKTGKRGRPPKRPAEPDEEEEGGAAGAEAAAEAAPGPAEGTSATEDPASEDTEPAQETEAARAEGSAAQAESAADGEHACSECGATFQRRYALIMHALRHEKARGFRCSLCNKEFQYAASLRAHLARHKHQKSQRAPLARTPAGEGGDPEEGGDGRLKGHRTKREFVCDICGKTLPKLYSLRIHMLNHTGVRPHACRVCGKSFARKHSLRMHRALHDAARQFHCALCDKSFASKRSMEEHTSVHTGESKYLCTTCGRAFHRASGLSKHLKKHQPKPDVRGFPCSHCEKSFYEAKDLQQHMNKHMGLKPFQCQVCGKCYSWKKDWYSHVKSHTVAEPYKCNVCGKEFFEKALFRRHVKKATHGKKGRVKQNLERECEHCGRKFTQLREYRRHINNHQGVKPFECLTCGVAWADARSLKRHVRTHTGERPYVCPVCQEAHIDARTLRKHMSKYHGDHVPGKIMLEKDTLQFHNQGTQVEHAVSILASDLPPELRPALPSPCSEEIETVLITEETVEAVDAVQAGDAVSSLSDQSIMQVVNYVLAQQAVLPPGAKLDEEDPEVLQTMEVEVAHVAEVE